MIRFGALGLLCLASLGPVHAMPRTPLALVAASTQAQAVVTCLANHLAPLVEPALLRSGLEARVAVHASAGDHPYFSVNLLLKPDVSTLLASLDQDAEAHPDIQGALLENLRHPIATKIYPWRESGGCQAAADWLSAMTRRAIDLGANSSP